MPFFELSIRILAQILGGLMAYRLNQSAWNFFLTPTHWYQTYNTSYGNCWTFLNVPTTFGFIIGQHICKVKIRCLENLRNSFAREKYCLKTFSALF